MSKYVKFESFAYGIVDEDTDIKEVHVDGLLTGSHDMDILAYCYMQAKSAREFAVHIDVTPSTYFRNSIIKRLCKYDYLIETGTGRTKKYISNKSKISI